MYHKYVKGKPARWAVVLQKEKLEGEQCKVCEICTQEG